MKPSYVGLSAGYGCQLRPLVNPRVPQQSRDLVVAFQPSGLVRCAKYVIDLKKIINLSNPHVCVSVTQSEIRKLAEIFPTSLQ